MLKTDQRPLQDFGADEGESHAGHDRVLGSLQAMRILQFKGEKKEKNTLGYIHTGNLQSSWLSSLGNWIKLKYNFHHILWFLMDCLVIFMLFVRRPLKMHFIPALSARFLSAWFTDLYLPRAARPVSMSRRVARSSTCLQFCPRQLPHFSSWAARGMRTPQGKEGKKESLPIIGEIFFLALSSHPYVLTLCYSHVLMSGNDAWHPSWWCMRTSLTQPYLLNLIFKNQYRCRT